MVCRDLKPQNVFMSEGGILKIGDFGVSRILSSTQAFANTVSLLTPCCQRWLHIILDDLYGDRRKSCTANVYNLLIFYCWGDLH